MITNYLSNSIVKGGVAPIFDTPSDYGLDYEDVSFAAADGTQLKGWLIKGAADQQISGKVIVESHFVVQCNRRGWSPKGKGPIKPWKEDIKFLRQAKHIAETGNSVLMYDMRGHGESDLGPKPCVSWGPEEAKDVLGVVDYIAERFPDAPIGLLSICMGSGSPPMTGWGHIRATCRPGLTNTCDALASNEMGCSCAGDRAGGGGAFYPQDLSC